ncbi:hypothetical protein Q1695_002890 [Nippostrongylus brasiliensis]|nr:hypothetical protein Q1695_002890 [Nippostrongylus brasiliensis]
MELALMTARPVPSAQVEEPQVNNTPAEYISRCRDGADPSLRDFSELLSTSLSMQLILLVAVTVSAVLAQMGQQYQQGAVPQQYAQQNQPSRFSQYSTNTGYTSNNGYASNTGYGNGYGTSSSYNNGYNNGYSSTPSYGYNSNSYTTTGYGNNRQYDANGQFYNGVSSVTVLAALATTAIAFVL